MLKRLSLPATRAQPYSSANRLSGRTLPCLLLLASLVTGLGGPSARANPVAGAPFDLQEFIDAELKAGKQRIVVPPGRYRVTPRQSVHLSFKNLTNIVIVATGVEMTLHRDRAGHQLRELPQRPFQGHDD